MQLSSCLMGIRMKAVFLCKSVQRFVVIELASLNTTVIQSFKLFWN